MQFCGAEISSGYSMFQSSPGQKAGCNTDPPLLLRARVSVSILTRPEGRMQLLNGCAKGKPGQGFQSSPGQKAGCNPSGVTLAALCLSLFQSSPGQKAGCNHSGTQWISGIFCFNPHPARRPDAIPALSRSTAAPMFQSSPGQKAGCNRW